MLRRKSCHCLTARKVKAIAERAGWAHALGDMISGINSPVAPGEQWAMDFMHDASALWIGPPIVPRSELRADIIRQEWP